MIKQLHEPDRTAAVALLKQSPIYNLYLLGNLAAVGFEQTYCQFWGDWGADGQLRAILNRYMDNWVIFGQPGADWAGLAAILDGHEVPANAVQDNPGGIDSWLPYLGRYRPATVTATHLMALDAHDFRPLPSPADVCVRRAEMGDLPRLVDFFADAESMTRSPGAVERPLRDTRVWLAEPMDGADGAEGNPILSTALTNAEVTDRAMIGGVFTPPAHRNRGLSRAVCAALCADLFADQKQPVLYWENPAAGKVYTKLGFHPIGLWRSVTLEATGKS